MTSAADFTTDAPVIDGYDVLDAIGRGGMGVVYEAVQRSTGKRVAIKFTVGASEALRRRFEREVDLVARLDHPNIVRLLDSGVHRGQYYFVMEFVDGAPLDTACGAGEVPVREALELMGQICDAVDYAHQRGVLHRDLKPGNILIANSGRVPKILDFGLAKGIDPRTGRWQDVTLSEPGQLLGTLGYMAPEQARGEAGQMSVRTDVYALGAILYELLSGSVPFATNGPLTEVLNRIADQPPAALTRTQQRIPRDVDAIVGKALAKEPARRYATAAELAADIRRFLRHEPIVARPIGWTERAARWIRRHRAVSAVGGAALVVLVSVGMYSALRIARSDRVARKDLRFALQALDKSVFDTDRLLKDVLGTQDVRRGLEEVALEFYENLPGDATLLGLESLTGPQYGRLGDLLREREDDQRAQHFYELALNAARATADQENSSGPAQRELAVALLRMARVESDPTLARTRIDEAVAVLRRFAPLGAENRAELAQALLQAAALSADQNNAGAANTDIDAGLAAFGPGEPADKADAVARAVALRSAVGIASRITAREEALELSRRLFSSAQQMAHRFQNEPDVQIEWLRSATTAADRMARFDAPAEAEAMLGTARGDVERLVAAHPENLRLRLAASGVYSYLGTAAYRAYSERGAARPDETQQAVQWFEKSNEIIRPAYELQPNDLSYRERYMNNLHAIGDAMLDSDPQSASAAYEKFLAVSEPLLGERSEVATLRAFAWSVVASQSAQNDRSKAAREYERGLDDLARLERRRTLSDYEKSIRESLRAGLSAVGAAASSSAQ